MGLISLSAHPPSQSVHLKQTIKSLSQQNIATLEALSSGGNDMQKELAKASVRACACACA